MGSILRTYLTRRRMRLIRPFIDASYRSWIWLAIRHGHRQRYSPFSVKVNGMCLEVPDSISFLLSYKEIFCNGQYEFRSRSSEPLIIDFGSNIGLSILYFKKLYPSARIIGMEADPQLFNYLSMNMQSNGHEDVELHNVAAWDSNTTLDFVSDGADGGRIGHQVGEKSIQIKAVDVRSIFPDSEVELIKMDIEGAEEVVLPACQAILPRVRNVILEYHARPNTARRMSKLISILEQSGFKYEIEAVWSNSQPLVDVRTNQQGFSYQANIYAFRN